ncbi:MAG: hypothetical protein K9M80_07660 [Candidatus Marinimicrobia bacterium]|nr:hypothetical protein [Candidatus Neomarinimicrobiota bacterium]
MDKKILNRLKNIEEKLSDLETNNKYPLWMDINQCSRYTSLGKSTIRRMVSNDEIPYQRAGNTTKLLFNRRQIDYYLLTKSKHPNKRQRKRMKEFIND